MATGHDAHDAHADDHGHAAHGHAAHGHDDHGTHGSEGDTWVVVPLVVGIVIAVVVAVIVGTGSGATPFA